MIDLMILKKDIILCSGRSFAAEKPGKNDLKQHYVEIKKRLIARGLAPRHYLQYLILSPQNGGFTVNGQRLYDANGETFSDLDLKESGLIENCIVNLRGDLLSTKRQQEVYETVTRDFTGKKSLGTKLLGFNFSIKLERRLSTFSIKRDILSWLDPKKYEILEGSEDDLVVFMPGVKGLDKARIVNLYHKNGKKIMAFGDNGEKNGNDYKMIKAADSGVDVLRYSNSLKNENLTAFLLQNIVKLYFVKMEDIVFINKNLKAAA